MLGDVYKCVVKLIQDIPFPKVSFSAPEMALKQSAGKIRIPLERTTNMRDNFVVDWFIKSENPNYKDLKGQVQFEEGQTEAYFEIDLPIFPQMEAKSGFSVCLDENNEMCQIGSVPDLSMCVENDVEPSAVEGG